MTQGRQQDQAGQAAQEGRQVGETAKDEARRVATRTREEASSLTSEALERTKDVAGEAMMRARQQADGQLSRLAGTMREMSGQLRTMAEAPQQHDTPVVKVAENAGSWMSTAADQLEQRGVDGLWNDAESFARRRPWMFLAAAAGLGLVTGRLVRAVEPSQLRADGGDGGQEWKPSAPAGGRPATVPPVGPTGPATLPSTSPEAERRPGEERSRQWP